MTGQLRVRIVSTQIGIVAALGIAWEIIGRHSAKVFFFVGSPSGVLREFWSLLVSGGLPRHFAITGSEAMLGLVIGTLAGSLLGLVFWYSETAARIAQPFILGFGTLPVLAFAPLMIVWFGIGFEMKVAMATFSTVFVAFNQAYRGARLVSSEYVDVLRGMNASRHQIFRKIIVPGSLDWVLGSMRLNVGFGLLGAFIGEFIAADKGLGYLILRAGGLYNVPRVLAAALGISILALGFDGLANLTERRRYIIVQWLSVPAILWKLPDKG